MSKRLVVALDGHDGAGKTTLAQMLASSLGGQTIRPFAGESGGRLLEIGLEANRATQNVDSLVRELIAHGQAAIGEALASLPGQNPVILDRGWMTVASFVPASETFFQEWSLWVPSALCWSDMATTLSRLGSRLDEEPETLAWHEHYLSVYLDLAERSGSAVIRTDASSESECLAQLVAWVKGGQYRHGTKR